MAKAVWQQVGSELVKVEGLHIEYHADDYGLFPAQGQEILKKVA